MTTLCPARVSVDGEGRAQLTGKGKRHSSGNVGLASEPWMRERDRPTRGRSHGKMDLSMGRKL